MNIETTEHSDHDGTLTQPWLEDFDQIRGYSDEEVPASVSRLCANNAFIDLLYNFFTLTQHTQSASVRQQTVQSALAALQQTNSIHSLQQLVSQIASPIVDMSVENLSVSGFDKLSKDSHYLFISNHRDILMDPLLLNLLLHGQQYQTAHCAIGDNLLGNAIALEFARLNKCFKVARSIKSPKAILMAMKLQSAYIRHLTFNHNSNIWIAQKEGRSKDNLDKTNPALIKMLGLAKPKHLTLGEYVDQLNIVPVSFSYEWDPCDIDKATELHLTAQQGHYQKEATEDLTAVKKGLLQSKGRVHIHFDTSLLNGQLNTLTYKEIAEAIDESISTHSKIYPVNYAAAQLLYDHGEDKEKQAPYSVEEITQAYHQLTRRLASCSPEIRQRVLQNYAVSLLR